MKTVSHEYYVDLEVAKLLKKAEFDWKVRYMYRNNNPTLCICAESPYRNVPKLNKCPMYWQYAAPTLDVAQRWLREIKCIHLYVRPILDEHKYVVTVVVDDLMWGQVNDNTGTAKRFNTYEEAQEAGIKKALEIILEKG